MGYFDRLQGGLNKQDLERFVKKKPSTKKVKLAPRNYGSDNIREKKRADAGQIDFYNYGGKKSKETKFEEMMSGQGFLDKYRKGDKKNKERKDWKKVAKDLGIDKVDSEEEVLQMIEYVRGGSMAKEEDEDAAEAPQPYSEPDPRVTDQPSENIQEFEETRITNPGNETPGPTFSNDPMKDSLNYGHDLTNHYEQKFIPSLIGEAKAGAEEIGESTRWHIKNFTGKIPKLGDPKEMLDHYEKEVFG